MRYFKNLIVVMLIIPFITFWTACDKTEQIYYYFEDNVIEMAVGDSIDISSLDAVTNVSTTSLVLVEEGLSADGFVITATSKGTSYVYVCNKTMRLASLQVNIYEKINAPETQPQFPDPQHDLGDNNQTNQNSITYTHNLITADGIDYYTLEFKKDGVNFANFSFEINNPQVQVSKTSNVLYVSCPVGLNFSLNIKDSSEYISFDIDFPLP